MDDNITRRERAEDVSGKARKSCRCRQRGCGAPPDGAVGFVNWRRLDFTGLSPKDAVHADDRSKIVAGWREALKNKRSKKK
jgi:hypothetical protein